MSLILGKNKDDDLVKLSLSSMQNILLVLVHQVPGKR